MSTRAWKVGGRETRNSPWKMETLRTEIITEVLKCERKSWKRHNNERERESDMYWRTTTVSVWIRSWKLGFRNMQTNKNRKGWFGLWLSFPSFFFFFYFIFYFILFYFISAYGRDVERGRKGRRPHHQPPYGVFWGFCVKPWALYKHIVLIWPVYVIPPLY